MDHTKVETIKKWLGTGAINIFGLPFAGKDTHGHFMAELLDASLLGGGDILRNSEIPAHIKAIMSEGSLIPTSDYIAIVLPYLSSEQYQNTPLVLSSVGRWHGEEDGVMQAAAASNHPVKAVIYLHITIKEAYDRFRDSQQLGDRDNRQDDSKENLITRFSEFDDKTLPVIEYYRQQGLLIDIDGRPPVDEVRRAIIDALYEFASR